MLFRHVAEEVRHHLTALGIRTIEEIVGREIVGEFDPAVDMREQARQERQNLTDSASE